MDWRQKVSDCHKCKLNRLNMYFITQNTKKKLQERKTKTILIVLRNVVLKLEVQMIMKRQFKLQWTLQFQGKNYINLN